MLEALAERPELEVIRLQDLPLEETRERLSRLPPDVVVMYNGINVDGTGRRFTPQEVLDDLAPASSRPIFATTDTYLGHGVVGGFLVDSEEIGVQAARFVGRVRSSTRWASWPRCATS